MTAITKVLVANRGEIAIRIFRSLERMGIPGVAAYHPADARSPALGMASETVEIDGPTPVASYLDVQGIIDACKRTGADAVHPGFGFLAENAGFARRLSEEGITFIGDKGIMTCGGWSGMPRLLPRELHREYERPEKVLPRVEGHHADWLQACKGGTPACSNFGYAARLVEFVHLANVALRTGKQLKWYAPTMKATNAPEADEYLKGEYRAGWELPV